MITRFDGTTKVADVTPTQLTTTDVLDLIYPIGSIAIGAKPSIGTWEKIEGRFLLGSSSSHAAGSTGGEENHTLTVNEMPSHTHNQNPPILAYGRSVNNSMSTFTNYSNDGWKGSDLLGNPILNTGGNQAHNNMPPYLSVDMWRRTA